MNNGAIDTMKTLFQPGLGPNLLFLWVGLAVILGVLIGYLIFSNIRKNHALMDKFLPGWKELRKELK